MIEYTIRKYDMEDYDIQSEQVDKMSNQELADSIRKIARGWLPDYNFSGDESDFDNHKRHMIMDRVDKILEDSR